MLSLIKKIFIKIFNLNYYTSKIDEFLMNYDKNHPNLSRSQTHEKKKFKRIAALRDNPHAAEKKPASGWSQF